MIRRLIELSARHLLFLLVVVPLALYSLYLAFVASERFVSESLVSVRQSGGEGSSIPGAAMLLAGFGSASHEDTRQLKDFIHSQGLMATLDARLKLRQHFAEAKGDLPFRLSPMADREQFVRYYRSRVEVEFDDKSSLLKVRTQGFSPAFAQQFNRAVLDESEQFVNETSHRIARERMHFAEGELELSTKRLQEAKGRLLAFQKKHRMLDPTAQAAGAGAVAMELQAQRSRLEAELRGLLAYLREDSFQVKTLQSKLAALDAQIASDLGRATSESRQGEQLNALSAEFQELQLKVQFALDAYKLSLATVENSRIDASRKLKSLVTFEPPTLPETAEYPLRVYNLATLLIVCLLLFSIVRLVVAIVREHHD
jgi:capsular polysaccharide transport system permease protein